MKGRNTMQGYDDDSIGGGRSFLGGVPIWLILILAAGFLVIMVACVALFFFTASRGTGVIDLPTLLPTAEVPTEEAEPTEPARAQTLTAVAVLELSPSPSPTAEATSAEITATPTFQPPTPRPTATPLVPIPTRTPIPPPPVILPTATTPPLPTATTLPANAWLGEYYANRDLQGSPAFTRQDSGTSIDFNWGFESPAGLPADSFSIRWSRTFNFAAGTYRFNAFSDDGIRVWLDNQLIINEWHDATNTTYSVERTLSAGNHSLRVEYYENTGAAQVRFWWETSTAFPNWRGEYFANTTLSGTPVIVRNDADINFNWGNGSPGSGVPSDRFSARWTRSLGFNAGTYRFNVRSDDGVRVWVDDQLIIDQWHDASNVTYSAERTLSAGTHAIRVEYYENLGTAQIQFWWELSGAYPQWKGEYFANVTLSGGPAVVRNDPNIDFNWGTGSPASGIPADNFSVRWTRSLAFDQGIHRFHVLVDDGARLYVDGQLIIDEWRDGVAREVTFDMELSAGDHLVRLEYYDRTDQARIRLWWDYLGATNFPNWRGAYFTNPNLSGDPAFLRNDLTVDFNWGTGSPAPGIPADNFSVRWSRTSNWQPGTYRLYVQANDGVRLRVDGVLVLNEWHANTGTTPYVVERFFTAGSHTVVIEYYDGTGVALIRFWRERIDD
jgi:hypothetical protein